MGSHWLLHVEVTRAGSLSKARPLRERQAVWTTGTRRVTCSGGVRPRGAPRSSDISTPAPWGGPPEVTRDVRGHTRGTVSMAGPVAAPRTQEGQRGRRPAGPVHPPTCPPARGAISVLQVLRSSGALTRPGRRRKGAKVSKTSEKTLQLLSARPCVCVREHESVCELV